MPAYTLACASCGRETSAHSGICGQCRRHPLATSEYRDRHVNDRDRTAAMELADFFARAEDEGWPYADTDDD